MPVVDAAVGATSLISTIPSPSSHCTMQYKVVGPPLPLHKLCLLGHSDAHARHWAPGPHPYPPYPPPSLARCP